MFLNSIGNCIKIINIHDKNGESVIIIYRKFRIFSVVIIIVLDKFESTGLVHNILTTTRDRPGR